MNTFRVSITLDYHEDFDSEPSDERVPFANLSTDDPMVVINRIKADFDIIKDGIQYEAGNNKIYLDYEDLVIRVEVFNDGSLSTEKFAKEIYDTLLKI